MTKTTRANAQKPANAPMMEAPEAISEKGTTQARENYEKASAAPAEATNLFKSSFSTAFQGVQDYNHKVIAFAQTNAKAALDFLQKLSHVKSPTDFVELATDHSREQFETLTEQTQELAALAQKVTLASAEPLKTGVTKVFNGAK